MYQNCALCRKTLLPTPYFQNLFCFRDQFWRDIKNSLTPHIGINGALAGGVDAFLIVVEPGRRSLDTAHTIYRLATEIGIKHCYAVGNKIRQQADREFIQNNLGDIPVIGFLSAHRGPPQMFNARLHVQNHDLVTVQNEMCYQRLKHGTFRTDTATAPMRYRA